MSRAIPQKKYDGSNIPRKVEQIHYLLSLCFNWGAGQFESKKMIFSFLEYSLFSKYNPRSFQLPHWIIRSKNTP